MRLILILSILSLSFSFISCGSTPERPGSMLTQAQIDSANAAAANDANSTIQAAASNTLPHYYCSNQCEGSGGDAQGNCPVCGTAYVHNAAFHNAAQSAPTPVSPGGVTTTPVSTTSTTVTPPQPPTEPAQNAAGVWHYTCANGCAGGGAGAGPCGSCGSDLAHNAAYHN